MAQLQLLLLILPLLGGVSCTFSLFLPGKSAASYAAQEYLHQSGGGQAQYLQQADYSHPQYLQQADYSQPQYIQQPEYSQPQYLQQPQSSSSEYVAESGQPSQEYQDDDPGYRYQSYQSTYRHRIQSVPFTYPQSTVYHQIPQHHHQLHQYHHVPEPVVVPSAHGVVPSAHGVVPSAHGVVPTPLPHRLAGPASLPVYQLVTVGPEVPVLVRLPNRQTAILPVRTVYSLPSFLESIVQRVQNYYSVYNPLEVLKVPRQNVTGPTGGETPETTTPAANLSTASESLGLKAATEEVSTVAATTDSTAATTDSASNDIDSETTTAQ